jgi:hypothetical protein
MVSVGMARRVGERRAYTRLDIGASSAFDGGLPYLI